MEEEEGEKVGERRGGTEGVKQKRMGREGTAKSFNIEEKPETKSSSLWSPLSLTCCVNLGKSLSLWAPVSCVKMKGLGSML